MEIVEHIQYDSDGCGDRCCQTDHGQAGIGLNTHDISKRQSNQECLDQSLCHDPYCLIISVKISDHNEVLKNCHKGEPVYLTKNGRGRFVVMNFEDYERDRAEKKLLMKLQEAEEAVKDGEGWLNLDELKALVGE